MRKTRKKLGKLRSCGFSYWTNIKRMLAVAVTNGIIAAAICATYFAGSTLIPYIIGGSCLLGLLGGSIGDIWLFIKKNNLKLGETDV
jgi:hypothetical protein